MSEKKYLVELSGEEREHLTSLIRKGKAAVIFPKKNGHEVNHVSGCRSVQTQLGIEPERGM